MKQLEVQIMGQSYMLTCPQDSEVRLREAVAKVDEAMCSIRDLGKVKARDRIAVLAALNLTFELMQSPPAPEPATAPVQAPAPAPQTPAAPKVPPTLGQPQPHAKASETGSKASSPQLQTLLQRLNAALGTNPSQPD